MSSSNKESKSTPNPTQPQNALFDSGLGSSINPCSGLFGEDYLQLSGSYESEYYDYDQDGGPLSIPLTSPPLLTTVTEDPSQQVSGDGENEDNSDNSTVAHSDETGSASTMVACTTILPATSTSTAHTDENSDSNSLDKCTTNVTSGRIAPKDDIDLSLSTTTANTTHVVNVDSNNSDMCSSDPNPIHNGTTSDSQNPGNSSDHESDADQDQNDIPSPILSHVRAQPLDIIIRGSVVENHSEIISERLLTENARAYSPPE